MGIPGGSGVRTQHFHCQGQVQSPVRTLGSHKPHGVTPPPPPSPPHLPPRERERERMKQSPCCICLSCLFGLTESGLGPQPYFVFLGVALLDLGHSLPWNVPWLGSVCRFLVMGFGRITSERCCQRNGAGPASCVCQDFQVSPCCWAHSAKVVCARPLPL